MSQTERPPYRDANHTAALSELHVRQKIGSWVKLAAEMRKHGFNRNANACRARWNVLRKMFEPNQPSQVELLARHRPWRKAA